jgi:hypothetical protein
MVGSTSEVFGSVKKYLNLRLEQGRYSLLTPSHSVSSKWARCLIQQLRRRGSERPGEPVQAAKAEAAAYQTP